MSTAKEAFAKLSKAKASNLPFSLHYEWWNEVVQKDWEVAIVEEKGEVKAVWPYFVRKRGPWTLLCQPDFTPYGGPIFNYPDQQKTERKNSFEQKVGEQIIKALPKFAEMDINCQLSLSNTLPFIWSDFEDRKKFTHLLDLKQSEEDIWGNFRENIRRQIRKAEKSLSIESSEDALLIDRLLQSTFSGQTSDYPIQDKTVYQRILDYLEKHQCGQLLVARDQDRKEHACLLYIYDDHSAYYLIGGVDQKFKNSGAMSLLLWESIRRCKSKSLELGSRLNHFNFEGSMIPAIEKYLRGFGGKLTPYSCLFKNQSLGLKAARKLL